MLNLRMSGQCPDTPDKTIVSPDKQPGHPRARKDPGHVRRPAGAVRLSGLPSPSALSALAQVRANYAAKGKLIEARAIEYAMKIVRGIK